MTVWSRIDRLKSEALWVFAGQAASAVSILVGVKVLTHFLEPREFGRLSLAITVVNLIGMNLFGPLGQGLMRFWSIAVDDGRLETFHAISKRYIVSLFLLVLTVVLIALLGLLFSIGSDWAMVLSLSVLVGGLTGWSRTRLLILMAARKRKIVALINSGTELSKPLVAALLIVVFLPGVRYVLIGHVLAMGVSLAIAVYYYRRTYEEALGLSSARKIDGPDTSEMGREILSFSMPFLLWGGFAWVHQSADRWALAVYQGTHVVGAYAVISQIAVYPLLFCSNFLSNLFLPIAYERAGSLSSSADIGSANRALTVMTGIYIAGAAAIVLVFYLFHHPIALIVSNQDFAGFSYLLPALTISWALYYLGQTLSGFGLLANKPRVYMLPIVSGGVLAALLTFSLAPAYGPAGVILGLGIAGGVYAVWCMVIARRILIPGQKADTGSP